ncbi:MAG: hypothetical protein MUF15_28760, partial [Acidobacteria bacterium]|nr:hypothetical protein [Acidobacteriota bacterium]
VYFFILPGYMECMPGHKKIIGETFLYMHYSTPFNEEIILNEYHKRIRNATLRKKFPRGAGGPP